MPLRNFNGDTFVAFVDISGFKELMKTEVRALMAIDQLYSAGYRILQEQNDVQGQFISDCGILIANNRDSNVQALLSLLNVIKQINRRMINQDFMLTTSIAYGRFIYEERIEFEGIGKTPIFGNAYVSAFLDNENGTPKLQPGQCRIVKRGLPDEVIEQLNMQFEQEFNFIRSKDNHFYYFWNVDHPEEIDNFIKKYNDTYQLKYHGMLNALQRPNQ